jgi:hypothetical protein
MAPPAHGYGFWAMLDARLAAEESSQAPPAPPLPPTPAPPEPPEPPPPPLAEVVPLSPRRRPGRWLLAAAAALVAVAGIAAITRGDDTKLETTPAAPTPTVETSPAPATTMVPEPTSVPVTGPTVPAAPGTTRPAATPTTLPRSTTTTNTPGGSTLSPAGLGPLRLGMTHQQAMATGAVGPYLTSVPGSCRPAGPAGSFRKSGFSVLFVEDKLVRYFVDRFSSLRTPQGVTNGSPSSMISSVPGTRTQAPDPFGSGTRITVLSGGSGYEFTVEQGAVAGWSVGTKAGLELDKGCG